jgi:hypothetical protein
MEIVMDALKERENGERERHLIFSEVPRKLYNINV